MARPDPAATSTSDIAVSLEGVHKHYDQRVRAESFGELARTFFRPRKRRVDALRDVCLEIRRGEIVAYAGPNGAGKSTTIKLLSSLLVPDAGRVRALGLDPSRDRIRYVGRIGVVFGQRSELYWDHPIAASFDWKRVVWGIPHDRFLRMQGRAKEILGLDEFFQTAASELSLGQRMRADLGLALLHEPELLLLDEPTLGLDVLARRRILTFLKDWNRETGVTVVVTSHDMAELEQLAGRIVMLHRGQIAFDGDFAALRRASGRRRILRITTAPDRPAPRLAGAELLSTSDGQHEFAFDAAERALPALLADAAGQVELVDVETHRPPIDEVVADLYEGWTGRPDK